MKGLVDNPKRRQVALDAALPRILNQDVVAVLNGKDNADELFDWLKQMPFVEERSDGWTYHDIARTQMLRQKRLISPTSWINLHGNIANHYEQLRIDLQLEQERQYKDAMWQRYALNILYHRLCQSPQKHLPVAINEFLVVLDTQLEFAQRWAETMIQAGRSVETTEVQRWGEQLMEGLQAYDERRYEIAFETFTDLFNYSGLEAQLRSIVFRWKGIIYGGMKRYEEALKEFSQAIELDPNYKKAISSRGLTYRRMKRGEEALKDFERVVELDPNSEAAIANRGFAYRLIGRYEDALKDFDRALELNPKFTWAICIRGRTYQNFERYEDAFADFNRAIKLNPSDNSAIAERGLTYFQMKRYQEALEDFNRSIEIDLNRAWLFAHRGEAYLMLGLCDKALTDFNHALRLDPDEDRFLYNRAITYQLISQLDNAKADFSIAIQFAQKKYEANSEDWNAILDLALYHLASGGMEQMKYFYTEFLRKGESQIRLRLAIQDLETFLRVFPDHEWAKKTKRALEKRVDGGEAG